MSNTISFTQREYDEFDEDRIGDRVRVGRRFGTRWVGAVAVRAQLIDISDIESSSAVDLFEVEVPT